MLFVSLIDHVFRRFLATIDDNKAKMQKKQPLTNKKFITINIFLLCSSVFIWHTQQNLHNIC